MICVPNSIPYVIPTAVYKTKVKKTNWKKTAAIVGGAIGLAILVAVIGAALFFPGTIPAAYASITSIFASTAKPVATYGAFNLVELPVHATVVGGKWGYLAAAGVLAA